MRRNSFMDEDGDVMHGQHGYSPKDGHKGLQELKAMEKAEKDMEVYKALWGKDHPDAGANTE